MTHSIQGYPFDYFDKLKYSPVYQHKIKQRTLVIPGGGCVYYRANKGDVCPFCAFPPFSRYVIKGENHEDYFESWALTADIYKAMLAESLKDNQHFDKLAVFNGGSFFPASELPNEFQIAVYEEAASRRNIKQLMVEAYPTFISQKKLIEAKSILGSTDLMVGIGFESLNEKVRNEYLKKRIDLAQFEEKVKLMQHLGVKVFIYAFLKAPQLTEGQALNETLNTIDYLHKLGVDEIALSCAFVPPGTNLESLYKMGEFRPPWLWSIIEIINTAQKQKWPLSIGGFEDTPPPVAAPSNCQKCDEVILEKIEKHRLSNQSNLFLDLNCQCKSEWQIQIGNSHSIVKKHNETKYQQIPTI
jgi:radical SAM enzyme (TIGR01210 family)